VPRRLLQCTHTDGGNQSGQQYANEAYRQRDQARTDTLGRKLRPPWSRTYYQCLQCDELWSGTVGPVDCPHCGCTYVLWLNR